MKFLFIFALTLASFFPVLAQATGTTSAPGSTEILQIVNGLGIGGTLTVAFLRGWITTGKQHQYVVDRLEKAEEENRKMRDVMEQQVIPEMIRTRESQERLVKVTADVIERLANKSR